MKKLIILFLFFLTIISCKNDDEPKKVIPEPTAELLQNFRIHIFKKRDAMLTRIESNIEGCRMPYVGIYIKHEECVSLLEEYLNSL